MVEVAQTQSTAPTHVMAPLLKELVIVVKQHRHAGIMDCAEDLITTFVGITRNSGINSTPSRSTDAGVVTITDQLAGALTKFKVDPALVAFVGLQSLCAGQTNELLVFKALIHSVTMRSRGVVGAGASIPKAVHRIRTDATAFVEHMLQNGQCLLGARLLIQHSCTKVPDKAEYRTGVAQSVADMMIEFHKRAGVSYDIFAWLGKYSRNPKIGYRNFAVEVVASLIDYINSTPGEEAFPMDNEDPQANRCTADLVELFVKLLIDRVSDKATSVRGRSLTLLAKLTAADGETTAFDAVFSKRLKIAPAPTAGQVQQQIAANSATPAARASITSAPSTPSAGSASFLQTIHRRAIDEKSAVRKASIQLIEAIIRRSTWVSEMELAQILARLCSDAALSVRKQALVSLTEAFNCHRDNATFQSMWLNAVLPLVLDQEDSIRTKCVEILEQHILAPVTSGGAPEATQLGWALLAAIDRKQDMRRYLQRIVSHWDRAGMLSPALYTTLLNHVCDPGKTGGWSLLSEMAACNPGQVNAEQVMQAWITRNLDDLVTSTSISNTLGHIAARLSSESKCTLADELRATLTEFTVPVSLVGGLLDCLIKVEASTVSKAALPASGIASKTKAFFGKLVKQCEMKIGAVSLSGETNNIYDEVAMARMIFSFGEVALVCPDLVTARHVLIIQALITPVLSSNSNTSTTSVNSTTRDSHPAAVRAHAFLTLGKLCLHDEDLAKNTIAAMARELETCEDPAVRNNIVFIMTDLCVRHPNFIQQYLPYIANRLRDTNPLVRRQTVTLITRLLKEDYIKLRHGLFFRLIMTAVDDDASVHALGKFCITSILHAKDASVASAHLIECLFHFNSNTDHAIYNRFPQSEKQIELFSLAGDHNTDKRYTLYKMMLELCTDVDRLNISQKICQDILGALADGSLKLTDGMKTVLQDALHVLASPEIKFESKVTKDVDEEDVRVIAASKAKATLISKLVKKNTAENIVPIIIALKTKLEKLHSPLMRDLMAYLRELMKDYKEEIAGA